VGLVGLGLGRVSRVRVSRVSIGVRVRAIGLGLWFGLRENVQEGKCFGGNVRLSSDSLTIADEIGRWDYRPSPSFQCFLHACQIALSH